MSVEVEIILRQILEEMKVQSQYLYDIRKRLEELEKVVEKVSTELHRG